MLLNKNDSLLILVDVQEKLAPFVTDSAALIARCEWLMRFALKMQVPLIVSEQYPKGLGKTIQPLDTFSTLENHIEKVHFSCMQSKNLIEKLKQHHKKQYVLIGIETHVCVLQTAVEMKSAGHEVYVVVDAVSSRNPMDKKYALKRMEQLGIHLVTSEMVFFEWLRQAGTPEFKALSKEFLQ